VEVSLLTIVATAAISAGTVVAMLYILCVRALHETTVHDLRAETQRLRAEYAERLARMRANMDQQVEMVSPGRPQKEG
jgi:hypothetical protein